MKCFRCGAALTRQDICLKCGTDVRLYKKIMYSADRLYNLALEKCRQRDLSSARNYLRQCLLLNKEHIPARNLMGLVYYELGEPAKAVREWAVSESFQDGDNLAVYYLSQIENDMAQIQASIKRYNQAVMYLSLNSYDLAFIQMKQLMSKPYRILRARQLMALMYMQGGYYTKASKLLKDCSRTDRGDPVTRRYTKALEERKAVGKDSSIRQAVVDVVEREPDVIAPVNNKEYGSYFMYVLYIMVGLVLGAGIIYYIVVPTVRTQEQQKTYDFLQGYEASMNDLQSDIVDYRAELTRLNAYIAVLKESPEVSGNDTVESYYLSLSSILTAYINNDVEAIMEEFLLLDPDVDDDYYQDIYQRLKRDYESNIGTRSYYKGMEYMDNGEYKDAVTCFEIKYLLDGADSGLVYYLGLNHEMQGDNEQAAYYYSYALATYESDGFTEAAQIRLDALKTSNPNLKIPEVTAGGELSGIITSLPTGVDTGAGQ